MPQNDVKRSRWLLLVLLLAGFVGGVFGARAFSRLTSIPTEDPLLLATSENLSNTVVTGHLEEKIVGGKNLLYCSTFQLAWNELKDFVGGDIVLDDEPALVKYLNKSLSTKADISEDSYLAMVGIAKEGIAQKVDSALKLKFGNEAPILNVSFETPDDILAYAFLLKELQFEQEFERLKNPILFHSDSGAVRVIAFGVQSFNMSKKTHHGIQEQVHILDYRNDSDFIIRLISTSSDDEIILAKVRPEETLLKTVQSVATRVKGTSGGCLHREYTLQIPVFNFDIKHSYEELLLKNLKNNGFEKYYIGVAIQEVRFRLNEKGAKLKSSATISVPANGPKPKKLTFDKPFLVYLKEKDGNYPYFALWVDNPELLVRY